MASADDAILWASFHQAEGGPCSAGLGGLTRRGPPGGEPLTFMAPRGVAGITSLASPPPSLFLPRTHVRAGRRHRKARESGVTPVRAGGLHAFQVPV